MPSRASAAASYWRQVMLFYGALRALGVDVDVQHPDVDLSRYRLIVAPTLQLMGEERARHFTWREAAAGTLAVYGEALEAGR